MIDPLIFLHALAGGLGILAFVWVAAELLRPAPAAVARAYTAAVLGTIFLLFSWAMSAFYYLTVYGPVVKSLVLQEAPWAHSIGMETKEHVFLFLPFLAILEVCLLQAYGQKPLPVRTALVVIALAIVVIGLVVMAEGYIVSAAARAALASGGGAT